MSIEPPSRLDLPETKIVMSLTKEQLNGGEEWVKTHKDTNIVETPLWVFISLGVQAINRQNEEDSTKCQANTKSTIKESCGHGQKQSISVPPVKHKTVEHSQVKCTVKPVQKGTEVTATKTRRERVMEIRKICGMLIAIGFIFMIGTIGAIDIDSISLTQGVVQIVLATIIIFIGVFGLNLKENKRTK